MTILDFRSDTVTKPTPEMREAMAQAEVGDDVYGDDPTVNRLQEIAAKITGKEAALFVTSGTMGNLAATLAHCQRGDEAIVGHLSHTYIYEAGGMAALVGVQPMVVNNQIDGTLDLEEVANAIRADDAHFPITRLIYIENTHNRRKGVPLSVEYTQALGNLAKQRGLKLHIDGARIFNAAVALNATVKQLAAPADSVTFCLSKGLSAPVGSVLCGSKDFIYRAHRARKLLGGGLRQAGVIAAAGIVALETMVERLADDHKRARQLAKGLAEIKGIEVNPDEQFTNMVYFDLAESISLSPESFQQALREKEVWFGHTGARRFRMVTHAWIDDAAVETAIEKIRAALT
jgi:threonine aldolase